MVYPWFLDILFQFVHYTLKQSVTSKGIFQTCLLFFVFYQLTKSKQSHIHMDS